ncbi:type IV pili methyl-accepting chemotaxis transducer N-terminal domain-containing protein [Aquimarina brevivitae]|uniref:PilJ/NarX-like methyl-accepting chemotaxis transducer n=1 Tax=Aquimarina brevivitae TaxID=323412 RepID=A0A4V2F5E5_9FLAO|nr:type IV pili methyl-accepting chemotaxis transducer N-terminal domain-containing protein [Aquimarina brevivitae]RZS92539.1 PilJ/NarX-like methyl-accepting chemotaxis transducer [Aquimarina brevivitae]
MRQYLGVLFMILFSLSCMGQQSTDKKISYGKAVNIAGRQRMLTQKLSKAYFFKLLGYDNFVIQEEIDSSVTRFLSQLDYLSNNFKGKNYTHHFKEIRREWKSFYRQLKRANDTTAARYIIEYNTSLLTHSNNIVREIESEYYQQKVFSRADSSRQIATENLIEIVDISGRQRMLAQRMCLYYLASKHFNNANDRYITHVKEVYEEFELSIIKLLESDFNNSKSRMHIAQLLFHWKGIKEEESNLFSKQFDIGDLYEITNNLTSVFEQITAIYQEIYETKVQ